MTRNLISIGIALVISALVANFLAACTSLRYGREPASEATRYYTSVPERAPIYVTDDTPEGAHSIDSAKAKKLAAIKTDPKLYDVIVVGGQLSGWIATQELARHHLHVLELETANADSVTASNSSAISIADGETIIDRPPKVSSRDLEISQIFKPFHSQNSAQAGRAPGAIETPVVDNLDAYYYKGVFYNHIWSEDTLNKLPAAFALFKQELKNEEAAHMIGDAPIEDSTHRHYQLVLDHTDAVSWIRDMPDQIRSHDDAESHKVYARFRNETFASDKVDPNMNSVIHFADLICRTRAGAPCRDLSALFVAKLMLESMSGHSYVKLNETLHNMREHLARNQFVTLRPFHDLEKIEGATSPVVTVQYHENGETYAAKSRAVIWTLNLRSVPDTVDGLTSVNTSTARKQVQLMRELTYAPVFRVQAVLNGDPFRASYQTWWQNPAASASAPASTASAAITPTSFFVPNFFAAANSETPLKSEIVTLLEPLPYDVVSHPLTTGAVLPADKAAALASDAIATWTRTFQPLFYSLNSKNSENLKAGAIHVQSVQVARAPASVLIIRPGHFAEDARFLRRHYGHVYFGSPDIGAPTFEEAVFRAHCAAYSALLQLKSKDFSLTGSSRCPIDR